MTTDEKVELAKQLARDLKSRWESFKREDAKRRHKPLRKDDLEFPRNEWQRWVNYFARVQSLNRALQLAEYQSRSPALRSDPKQAAQVIRYILGSHQTELQQLSVTDLMEIFGYVSRWLEWLNFSGGQHEESSHRHVGRSPSSRHGSH
jgi:hypothetical protein